jgi:hypothetical protein
MIVNTSPNQPTVIPGSTRPDGTKRPDIKVKPGYTPQEMVPSYVIPQKQGQSGPVEPQPSTSTGKDQPKKAAQDKDGKNKQKQEQPTQPAELYIPGMDPELMKKLKEEEEKKKAKKRVRGKNKKENIDVNIEDTKEDDSVKIPEKPAPITTTTETKPTVTIEEPKVKKEKGKGPVERKQSSTSKDSGDEGISAGDDPETAKKKKIRNLKKKLKQIEMLEEKKRVGTALNADEVAKVTSKKEVLVKLHDLSIK